MFDGSRCERQTKVRIMYDSMCVVEVRGALSLGVPLSKVFNAVLMQIRRGNEDVPKPALDSITPLKAPKRVVGRTREPLGLLT